MDPDSGRGRLGGNALHIAGSYVNNKKFCRIRARLTTATCHYRDGR